MRISDDVLDEFLDTLTDDVVPRSQFGDLLKDATQGRFDRSQLFDQLRVELSAQHMRMMAGSGLFAMSPSLAWDAFNRMGRRVKAELLPLPVADFQSKVTDQPTEVQIAALYEEGKDRYAAPDSPESGFKRRCKIAFQYLKADFEKFLQEQMASVTKEQVAEYYEKNKNDFKVTETPPAEKAEPADATPSSAKPAAAARPGPTEAAKSAEAGKPDENAMSTETAKPAEQPQPAPVEAKKSESEPAAKKPPADEPAAKEVELKLDAPASDKGPAPAGESKQTRSDFQRQNGQLTFVSYNAEEAAKETPKTRRRRSPARRRPPNRRRSP